MFFKVEVLYLGLIIERTLKVIGISDFSVAKKVEVRGRREQSGLFSSTPLGLLDGTRCKACKTCGA